MEKYLKIYKKFKLGSSQNDVVLIPVTNILAVKILRLSEEIQIIYNDRTKSGKRATVITTYWSTDSSSSYNDAKIIFKREILDALASDQKFTLSTLIVGDVTTNVTK